MFETHKDVNQLKWSNIRDSPTKNKDLHHSSDQDVRSPEKPIAAKKSKEPSQNDDDYSDFQDNGYEVEKKLDSSDELDNRNKVTTSAYQDQNKSEKSIKIDDSQDNEQAMAAPYSGKQNEMSESQLLE